VEQDQLSVSKGMTPTELVHVLTALVVRRVFLPVL
jgi:hypothetical protein